MCSLSVCADNVTEKEAESFKWLSTFFSDDYEKQKPRSGNPSLDKAPIANGLLTKTTRGVYKTAQSLKIHPAKNHYFMPPTAKFFHGQLFRLYAFEGSIESVCSCPLGEFTVKISSVNADTLACETLDYGRRPRRIEFPASALPVDVALYSRRDGAGRDENDFAARGAERAYPRHYAAQGDIVGPSSLFRDRMRSDLHNDAARVLEDGSLPQLNVVHHFFLPSTG
jgi:hypothetical protein